MNHKKMMLIFPHLPNPRMIKRIEVLKTEFDLEVIYWDRKLDIGRINEVPNDVKTKVITRKANEGNPLRRINTTFSVLYNIWNYIIEFKPDTLYISKTDMLIAGVIYKLMKNKGVNLIYEVSDIHPLLIDQQRGILYRLISNALKMVERFLSNRVDLLVVTSEYFYESFYIKWIDFSKVFFLPNTPDSTVFNNYCREHNEKFTVGFIGAIRYAKQLEMLIDIAKVCDINVFIAGKGVDYERIENYSKDNDNVEIYGEYVYKTEIKRLYEKVDCIYSVYDTNLENVKIALPNRLYESVYTNTPIIVSKGTYLGKIVDRNEIGIAINSDYPKELEQAIIDLKNNKELRRLIKKNCEKLKDKWKLDTYNKNLIIKLKELGIL
jgi:glycosyltransferase involved in cell wall biosynthesis